LYAIQVKKKTWVIVIGPDFPCDKPVNQLDLPREADHSDPAGYQAERLALQRKYLAHLKRENHLRHSANNRDQLELIVRRLRDELGELRRQWEEWLLKDAEHKAHTRASLAALAEASRLTTEKIRAHLFHTAEETHRHELAEADHVTDWRRRQELREAADHAQAMRLARIEELAASFAEIEGRGTATTVFQEMTRVLTEQGVDEAIDYVESQRGSILQTVRARAATARARNRADLQPLLRTAALHDAKGQANEARHLYAEILEIDPEWDDALQAAFWFHVEQGDLARIRTTLSDSRQDYEAAQRIANRRVSADPSNTEWQRDLSVSYDKLGDVAMAQGQLDAAAQAYRDSLGVRKKLAAADPSNTEWQRDLIVSNVKLGELTADKAYVLKALDIAQTMQQRGTLAPRDAWMVDDLKRRAGQ
jgi:tetratricopeptide (TPR) repeat protein